MDVSEVRLSGCSDLSTFFFLFALSSNTKSPEGPAQTPWRHEAAESTSPCKQCEEMIQPKQLLLLCHADPLFFPCFFSSAALFMSRPETYETVKPPRRAVLRHVTALQRRVVADQRPVTTWILGMQLSAVMILAAVLWGSITDSTVLHWWGSFLLTWC